MAARRISAHEGKVGTAAVPIFRAPAPAKAGMTRPPQRASSSPFLVSQLPHAKAWVLTFGTQPVLIEAAIRAVKGEVNFLGHLPVTLPTSLAPAHSGSEHSKSGPSFA